MEATIGEPLGFSVDGERLAVRRGDRIGTFRVHRSRVCRIPMGPGGRHLSARHAAFSPTGALALGTSDAIWFKEPKPDAIAYRVAGRQADQLEFQGETNLYAVSNVRFVRFPVSQEDGGRRRVGTAEQIWHGNERIGGIALDAKREKAVVSFGRDGVVLNLATGKPDFSFVGPWGTGGLSISDGAEWFATGYWNNRFSGGEQAHIFSGRDGKVVQKLEAGNSNTQFSPDNKWLFLSTPEEHRQYSTGDWKLARKYPIDGVMMLAGKVVFRADGKLVAVEAGHERVRLIDPASGEIRLTLTAPVQTGPGNLAWSADGRWLLQAHRDQTFLWDLQSLEASLRELGLGLID